MSSSFKRQLSSALLVNLSLKIVSFTLSTTLTRLLLPEQSGIGFSYAIYTDTALFLAREAVRNVASRQRVPPLHDTDAEEEEENTTKPTPAQLVERGAALREVVYCGYLAVPIGLVAMLLMESQFLLGVSMFPCLLREVYRTSLFHISDFFPSLASQTASAWSHVFSSCLALLPHLFIWFSVFAMLLAEPCIVVAQCLGCFSRVVVSECVALVTRLAVTIAFVHFSPMHDNWETQLFFSFGYVSASLVHLIYWLVTCRRRRQAQTPAQRTQQNGADGPTPSMRVSSRAGDALSCAVADSYVFAPAQLSANGSFQEESSLTQSLPFPFHCFVAPALSRTARRHHALLATFGRESVLRLVLSEGEKFTLTVFGSTTARGHYEVITHLGSLVARLVFRVWENACGVRWSQLVASGQPEAAVQLLALMLRLAVSVGLTFPLLGPPLAKFFLTTLYSSRWSSPAMVSALQWFCLVVPCMAMNGLLEAYLRAAATSLTLRRLQTCMVTESIVYMVACYAVLGTSLLSVASSCWPLRAMGVDLSEQDSITPLVCLNLANMLTRIARSIMLILRDGHPVQLKHDEHSKTTAAEKGVVVPVSVFTSLVHPSFGVAIAVLFAITRAADSVAVALVAACGYPVLLLLLDPSVRALAQRALGSRGRVSDAKKQA